MKELELIKELMEELEGKMKYGEDDFNMRLGKKKPELEVVKIEGKLPKEGMMSMDHPDEEEDKELIKSMVPEMMEEAMEGEEEDEDMGMKGPMMGEEEMDPTMKLKQRLMKLRGQ